MMVLLVSETQMKLWTQVKDPHLNKLFQEVKKDFPDLHISEHVFTKKKFFRENKSTVKYSLYSDIGGHQLQQLMVPTEFLSLSNVYGYLYGLINGLNVGLKLKK